MIKKLLILSAFYAVATILVTMTMLNEESFMIILVSLNMLFATLIVYIIYKNFSRAKQNVSTDLNPNSSFFDSKTVHKISQKPFLLGIEKRSISNEDFYFDQDYFYAVAPSGLFSKYLLTDIAELSGTATQINNSRIWQIKINRGLDLTEYRFAHNYTIWNKNFYHFYVRMKEIKPEAVKSDWSLWRM